jgi:sugar lactone lactonase YvrE
MMRTGRVAEQHILGPVTYPRLNPRIWQPPRDAGLTGPFRRNEAAATVRTIAVPGINPEDVAVDAEGRVYTGTDNGAILRITPGLRRVERVAETGGRPLGIEVDADGTLVVCDAHRGLLRVDPAIGSVRTLVRQVDGRALVFANNCSIASDGSVYFSESSVRFPFERFKGDLLEHSSTGRLMRWTPDGVEVLLTGLDFANGVALAADDSFVLIAETGGYRIRKLWLTGDRAGTAEVICENLPGLPDNISRGSGDMFWIGMPSTRNSLLDRLLPRPGWLRKAVWALPDSLQPDAAHIAWVLGIDGDGTVRANLQAHGASVHAVTGVREHGGVLYLGNLGGAHVGVLDLATATRIGAGHGG